MKTSTLRPRNLEISVTARSVYAHGKRSHIVYDAAYQELFATGGSAQGAADAIGRTLRALALTVECIAVRALQDGRIAVIRVDGAGEDGRLHFLLQYIGQDGRTAGAAMGDLAVTLNDDVYTIRKALAAELEIHVNGRGV